MTSTVVWLGVLCFWLVLLNLVVWLCAVRVRTRGERPQEEESGALYRGH